jgi:hypothetical protein
VAFTLSHADRSIMTAVLPPLPNAPLFRVPVKHERHGRGSEGALLMYDDALVYQTKGDAEARYWRFKDLFAVLHSTASDSRSSPMKAALASCDRLRFN